MLRNGVIKCTTVWFQITIYVCIAQHSIAPAAAAAAVFLRFCLPHTYIVNICLQNFIYRIALLKSIASRWLFCVPRASLRGINCGLWKVALSEAKVIWTTQNLRISLISSNYSKRRVARGPPNAHTHKHTQRALPVWWSIMCWLVYYFKNNSFQRLS